MLIISIHANKGCSLDCDLHHVTDSERLIGPGTVHHARDPRNSDMLRSGKKKSSVHACVGSGERTNRVAIFIYTFLSICQANTSIFQLFGYVLVVVGNNMRTVSQRKKERKKRVRAALVCF